MATISLRKANINILAGLAAVLVLTCGFGQMNILNEKNGTSPDGTVSDITPPTKTANPVTGSVISALSQVDITYSEPVSGADTIGNYSLSGAGIESLSLDSVAYQSGNTYRLTITGSLTNGSITITIANISDQAGNALSGTTIGYTGDITNPIDYAAVIEILSATPATGSSCLNPLLVHDSDVRACQVDNDCTKVNKNIVCSCNNGGDEYSINKAYQAVWDQKAFEQWQAIPPTSVCVCLTVIVCFAQGVQCVNNKCTLTY